MSKAIAVGIVGVSVSFAMLAFGFLAGNRADIARQAPPMVASQPSAGIGFDRAGVETIVREYLLENPELFLEVQQALEFKQREAERIAQVDTITTASAEIFNAEFDGIVGNPEGSVTIVEFFDYNCGYCKRALDDMEALVAADDDLRFVLKEFPILGPDSQRAHVVSMAFRTLHPELYGDFHRDLMMGGRATEATAISVALSHGAAEEALRAEMQNPAIIEAFGRTYELANRLAITGTPSYVVGNEVVFGALGQQVLAGKIEDVRACVDSIC